VSLALAVGLLSEGHAALSAGWPGESRDENARAGKTRGVAVCRSSHGGCVHAGLRRGRRRLRSALAAFTYLTIDQRYGDAGERGGASGKQADVCGHGSEYEQYGSYVERQRRARRKCDGGDDYGGWRVYGAGRSSCRYRGIASEGSGHGDESRGWDEICDRGRDDHQRCRDRA
jgi:hypothetical protein